MTFWTKAKLDRHIAVAIARRDAEREKESADPHPLPPSYDAEEEAVTLLGLWRERILPADEIVRRCDLHGERHRRDFYGLSSFGIVGTYPNTRHSMGAENVVARIRLEANAEATKLAAKTAKDALKRGNRHV